MLLKTNHNNNPIKKLAGLLGKIVGVSAVGAFLAIPLLSQTASAQVNSTVPTFNPPSSNVSQGNTVGNSTAQNNPLTPTAPGVTPPLNGLPISPNSVPPLGTGGVPDSVNVTPATGTTSGTTIQNNGNTSTGGLTPTTPGATTSPNGTTTNTGTTAPNGGFGILNLPNGSSPGSRPAGSTNSGF